jgi:hypothetical protein
VTGLVEEIPGPVTISPTETADAEVMLPHPAVAVEGGIATIVSSVVVLYELAVTVMIP